ncbi:MAG: hypothetical protein ACRDF0_09445 [Candidatus Limnocylindria bacterium]
MRGAEVRLAELLASLSLAFDLGLGRPLEHTLRATYLAGRLSQRLGLRDEERRDVFYASLLQNVGCVAYTPEMVRAFVADDIVAAEVSPFLVDPLRLLRFMATHVGSAGPLYARPATLARALATGPAVFREHDKTFCEVGALLARRLGLGEGVAGTLLQRAARTCSQEQVRAPARRHHPGRGREGTRYLPRRSSRGRPRSGRPSIHRS